MLVCKGYIVPNNRNLIYKNLKDIKEKIDKGILNIKYTPENYKVQYYATYNDGEMLIPPVDTFEEIMKKCEEINPGLWEYERKIIINFEGEDIANFYDAYQYLRHHPIFSGSFEDCLKFKVIKINPESLKIDDNISLNTKTQILMECGPLVNGEMRKDEDLSCGDDTFETTIIELAELVRSFYSDSKEYALKRVKEKFN